MDKLRRAGSNISGLTKYERETQEKEKKAEVFRNLAEVLRY
jgi:hypothetical protein